MGIEFAAPRKRILSSTPLNVMVSATKSQGVVKTCSVIIRNDMCKNITNTGYVAIGITETRMYFKESSKGCGHKTSAMKNEHNFCMKACNPQLVNWAVKFAGEYTLKFDDDTEMYYIGD